MTSLLYKALGATKPLFEVTSHYLDPIGDDAISSITIDAGSTMAGISTVSATIQVRNYRPVRPLSDQRIFINLSAYGAGLIAGLTDSWAPLIRPRFQGRTTEQTVRHTGPGNARKETQIIAQDWAAMIGQLPRGAFLSSPPTLARLYGSLWVNNSPLVPGTTRPENPLQHWGSAWHHVATEDVQDGQISSSDVVGKYTADVGNLIRISRDGTPTAWSHDHLVALGDNWQDVNPDPLQVHQVMAPIDWKIPATYPTEIEYTYRPAMGSPSIGTGTTQIGNPDENWLYKRVTLDTTHVYPVGGHAGIAAAIRARALRESGSRYRIQKIQVDALKLIRRNQGTDRRMVGQLLTMNHGDPLALSSDWEQASGLYFVRRISNRITPSEWTIELELEHSMEVTGFPHAGVPRGRTWETAYSVNTGWNTPQTTWETSP